jgi:hypothetical protein
MRSESAFSLQKAESIPCQEWLKASKFTFIERTRQQRSASIEQEMT